MAKFIRSSKHTIKFTNVGKQKLYSDFIQEYRRVASIFLDYLWENKIEHNNYILDIKNDKLNCPKFINKDINSVVTTPLSARVLKCCATQVLGIISASIEKRRKLLWLIQKLESENKDSSKVKSKLQSLVKPNINFVNPELNSLCCDFQIENKYFNGFLQLKCLGKQFGKIKIPIKFHRNSNKWNLQGKIMSSFLLKDSYINIRWEIEKRNSKQGIILGADQGLKAVLTLSNGETTPIKCNHNHTLESITRKLSKKRKGSKAFAKAQEHRKNFINWSINKLNFNSIKELRLEKIVNIGFGKRKSRFMSHWCNTLIRDKILRICEELEVQVVQQDSTYRSQRCSQCGLVRKASRKGKIYLCKCGLEIDSDLNAAKNHEQDLPKIPFDLRRLRRNLGNGFYWKPSGFFEITGEELTVPLSKNERL